MGRDPRRHVGGRAETPRWHRVSPVKLRRKVTGSSAPAEHHQRHTRLQQQPSSSTARPDMAGTIRSSGDTSTTCTARSNGNRTERRDWPRSRSRSPLRRSNAKAPRLCRPRADPTSSAARGRTPSMGHSCRAGRTRVWPRSTPPPTCWSARRGHQRIHLQRGQVAGCGGKNPLTLGGKIIARSEVVTDGVAVHDQIGWPACALTARKRRGRCAAFNPVL